MVSHSIFKPKHKQCLSRQSFFVIVHSLASVAEWTEQSWWHFPLILLHFTHLELPTQCTSDLPSTAAKGLLTLCTSETLQWAELPLIFWGWLFLPHRANTFIGIAHFLSEGFFFYILFPERLQSDFHLGALTLVHMDRICAVTLLPVYRTVRELNAHMGEPGWKQIISDWCF